MVVLGCSSQQNQKEVDAGDRCPCGYGWCWVLGGGGCEEESSECQVEPCSYHAKNGGTGCTVQGLPWCRLPYHGGARRNGVDIHWRPFLSAGNSCTLGVGFIVHSGGCSGQICGVAQLVSAAPPLMSSQVFVVVLKTLLDDVMAAKFSSRRSQWATCDRHVECGLRGGPRQKGAQDTIGVPSVARSREGVFIWPALAPAAHSLHWRGSANQGAAVRQLVAHDQSPVSCLWSSLVEVWLLLNSGAWTSSLLPETVR